MDQEEEKEIDLDEEAALPDDLMLDEDLGIEDPDSSFT
jgi:hypothetical protein